jgi:hypothetical protein
MATRADVSVAIVCSMRSRTKACRSKISPGSGLSAAPRGTLRISAPREKSIGGLVIRAAAFEPRVRRVIAYDIMTNGLECFLRPLPPQAQKELLGWIDTGNEGAVDKFFADAMAKRLLLDWMMKLAMHNSGQRTPYASLKHYQKYETGSISSLLAQDVLLMAGAEDHYIPVHQLPDQIATLTHVRSLTARLFTRAEQAQNHCQIGNMGLAFRVIIDWMESLGTIERPHP